jgi:hypothetical protein
MSRKMRLYYNTILGAIGGLVGWQISNILGLSFTPNMVTAEAVVGALIGFSIGLLIGFSSGFSSRSLLRALRDGAISGLLGAFGGAIGLPIAEQVFQLLGADSLSRAFGWGLFGLLIGLAAGVTGGSQVWKPALGGTIGGVVGGFFLELARTQLADALLGKAVGLALLGASTGIFIALIVFLLSRAWFEITSGKLAGTEFILDKFLSSNGPSAFIGSSPLKSDIVLPDPDVSPQHAMLHGKDTYFLLKDMSQQGTFIDKRRIEQTNLKDHQKITMGNTEMVYHERR